MIYKILSSNPDDFAIRVLRKTFRTRIEFNWTPPEKFYGIAVVCNYHYLGHPVGTLHDNNLVVTRVRTTMPRPTFEINGDTVIQAGPTLVQDGKRMKRVHGFSEGFHKRNLKIGFHPYIGMAKNGSLILGYHKDINIAGLCDRCIKYKAVEALKLPGLHQGGFIFNNRQTHIRVGVDMFPVALIIEPLLKDRGNRFGKRS